MPVLEIADLSAPEAAPYFHLTDAQLRSRQTPEKGLFIAEGPKVVLSALGAGCQPISLLMRRKMLTGPGAEIRALCPDVPVLTGDDDTLAALTGFRLQRSWVLCAMKRPPMGTPERVMASARRVALLEGITEPSNVGAIFRSAAALGCGGILLSPTCCDPLHRRAVRVCMGAVFQVPWAFTGADGALPMLKAAGFRVLGLALRENCLTLDDPALLAWDKIALCLGTEDTGLTEQTLDRCDDIVRIPMAAGIDSLNVAAASAVAFWQLRVR